jgi:predicted TIM-barrel fold metal-dependent hydrolase
VIEYRGQSIEVWDAHAHLGRRMSMGIAHAIEIKSFQADELIAQMDACGVDVATPFPIGVGPEADYADLNLQVARAGLDYPGRIRGFGRLNPGFALEHNRRLLEDALAHGLRGLKLHPLIERFPADDRQRVYPLLELAEHFRLPVVFHCGMGDLASPDRIAQVARDFPRVNVIAGHAGLSEGVPRVIEHARHLPNLFMDTSAVGWLTLVCDAILWAGPERVLFGSDAPFNTVRMELDKLAVHANRLLQLSVEDFRLVMGGNLKRLLGVVA